MKGKFIVLDGIDGCGKSSQFSLLAQSVFLSNKYNHVLKTREPWKSREIRAVLNEEEAPEKQAERLADLFIQDRIEHVKEVIEPSLEKGIHVLSDRYKHATIAYQSAQGLSMQKLIDAQAGLLVPDVFVIIDLPAEIASGRMNNDLRVRQKFEKSLEFLEKVRQNYLKMPNLLSNEKIVIVNGLKSIGEIHRDIIHKINNILGWDLKPVL